MYGVIASENCYSRRGFKPAHQGEKLRRGSSLTFKTSLTYFHVLSLNIFTSAQLTRKNEHNFDYLKHYPNQFKPLLTGNCEFKQLLPVWCLLLEGHVHLLVFQDLLSS